MSGEQTLADDYDGPTEFRLNPTEQYGWDDYCLEERSDGTIIISEVEYDE